MVVRDTELCEHFGNIDFIEHLFIYCSSLEGFWRNVSQIVLQKTGLQVPMTETNILLVVGDIVRQNQMVPALLCNFMRFWL